MIKIIQEEDTITNYIQNLKVIINNLTLIDHPLNGEEEVIIHTFNNL